jgi:pimeloyl-ACP methyl ester carboxylesterase
MFKPLHQTLAPLFLVLAMLLAACGGQATTPTAVPTPTAAAAAPAAPTAVPTEAAAAPTAAPAPTAVAAAPAPLAWQRCSEQIPAEFECAQMQVPMDYADPNGPTITLVLTRLQATDSASRIGSLIFNPGGPGEPASDIIGLQAQANLPFTPKLRQYFDIVGFDPRGVGLSTPVKCDPALWNASESLFPRDQAAYDAMVANTTAFGQSCLEKTGPALAHLDTMTVARDLDAVRAALGDEKLNYFGTSYGTMIGAQYAELFPQNIRVMALDGTLDHSQSENTFHFVEVKAFEQVFEGFAASSSNSSRCHRTQSSMLCNARLDRLAQP